MERIFRYCFIIAFLVLIFSVGYGNSGDKKYFANNHYTLNKFIFPPDSTETGDTTKHIDLIYPLEDEGFPYTGKENSDPMLLNLPSSVKSDVEYDPTTGLYVLRHKIGDIDFRPPTYMTLEEYRDYEMQNAVDDYWKERATAAGVGNRGGIIPEIYIGGKAFDKIFGGNTIDIRPSGSVELTFGVLSNSRDDPTIPVKQRSQTNFDFNEKIQMNVVAKIGDKIEFKTTYNTEATFNFENKLNLRYEGDEDEIIQLVEAGDVSLPLNSTLITGSQSLFGIKSKLKFGRTTVTAIFSEQQSETSTITVQGGAQRNDFLFKADEYEENRHFFLGHFFGGENYKEALSDLPLVRSGITITKIEVWITNVGAAVTDNRNIIAFNDLGEFDRIYNTEKISPTPNPYAAYPDNRSNNLFSVIDTAQVRDINNATNYLVGQGFVPGEDFDKIELARKLNPSEYTVNNLLGFISLNTTLNSDQTLAVAFQYKLIGQDSTVFQVGDFSDEGIIGQSALIVKLLKSTYVDTKNPRWDLMMKNVYSLNAYQVNRDDFTLNILYSGDEDGVPTGYFVEGPFSGQPLIQIFNLDKLNQQNNPPADGIFDFIDNAATQGGLINSSNGRIFFPVTEPFGSYLRQKFIDEGTPEYADKYCYDSLYTMTKTGAQQYADKNKYLISGYYKSQSGSEISLNAMNVPQGSVTVTAGGVPLVENVDYTVDYTLGRVRIINEGILNSGTPINVKLESNTMFSIQTKRLMGAHVDFDLSRDFHLGGTILNLHEKPFSEKVNYGDEPISNTMWGLDYRYQTESRFITKLVDALPFISTTATSTIAVDGEFAHFIPGHSKQVGKTGNSYIDDFEGSESKIDLRNFGTWFVASTPQNQSELFPEAGNLDVSYGFNRAKLAWYTIDPTVFYDRNSNLRPPNITNDDVSGQFVRQVLETEVYPNKDIPNGDPTNIGVLNLAFYPSEIGPYNYDNQPSGVSAGISDTGALLDPQTRWGGIMRQIETSDFEAANISYIKFWVMDPFADGTLNTNELGGDLYINLGDISEDILKDSRKAYENGLPTIANPTIDDLDTTIWGRVPNKLNLVQSFSNDAGAREYQDVGYDGLRDEDERNFFSEQSASDKKYPYLDYVASLYGENSIAYQMASNDPSSDNYHNYRGDDYDNDPQYSSVLRRYKNYNGVEGNSPENTGTGAYDGNTRQPNMEDINDDNTLSEGERYFQYHIKINPAQMKVGENYITDINEAAGIRLPNGEITTVKWYQFKIPIRNPDKVIGGIDDFKSIRFMRMFLQGFSEPVVLRFASLDLVREQWRIYPSSEDLLAPGEYIPNSSSNATTFDISAVNIEENSGRSPVPYVMPPGIERQTVIGTTDLRQLNEQSMELTVTDLVDGDVAAVYKTTDFDFRQFKRLQMFVHAEQKEDPNTSNVAYKPGDLTVFIRIGADFTQNYYEYEVPLDFTTWHTSDPQAIWPESNELNIDLDKLVQFKLQRNTIMREPGSNVSLSIPYVGYDGENKVSVMGSPSISDVEVIMIGIRNPIFLNDPNDPGNPRSAIIWVNELRLTNFNKSTGWATTGRVTMNLADLGNLSVSGTYKSAWFASLDQKITEIDLNAQGSFDIATNLELGKFFPEKAGVRIPMHFDYGESRINPTFNPLDPDLKLDEVIDSYDLKEQQDSIKKMTVDYTQRKNLNFMNVRKDKVGAQKKSHIYDIENFDLSYSYSELYHRNTDIEYDLNQNYMGGLGYNFNTNPKNVRPFEKIGFISKNKGLLLIKDFNFYFMPKMFSFRTDMNRMYSTRKLRDKSFGDVKTFATYNKTWDWNRRYDLKFDLAKSLTFSFNANAQSFIKEYPGSNKEYWEGELGDEYIEFTPDEKQELVSDQIKTGGTKKNYTQNATINYNIPINKFPMLDWVNAQASYTVTYSWNASPIQFQEELGNQVANNVNISLNGNADFNKLYNKSKFLKDINKPPRNKNQGKKNNKNKGQKNPADTTQTKPRVNYGKIAYEAFFKILMSVKKVTGQYSANDGTNLPGFMPEPGAMGNNWGMDAPGMAFIFGAQPDGPDYFNQEGWLSQSTKLNTAYGKNHNESFNMRATLEPFKDFKVDITIDRTFSNNIQTYYVFDTVSNSFIENSWMQGGSFSMSFFSWRTAFGGELPDDGSEYFNDFLSNRSTVANRVSEEDPRSIPVNDTTGYPEGYGANSQYVLIPSFLAAYGGKSPDAVDLNPFPKIPLPNWRISYNGLSRIPALKKIFKSVTLNHAYRSSYAAGSYNTNINFSGDTINGSVYPVNINPNNGDFYPEVEFGIISITEQFVPLINVDVQLQNSLLAKVEFKKARNLSLSFANNQLTEVRSSEVTVGIGYRFKDLPITFASFSGNSKRTMKSDLNIKLDFSIRENKTVLRNINSNLNQISAGQKVVSINFSSDYMLSQSMTIRFYFDKIINNPFLPSQYRNSTTKGGITLRFSLAQ